MKWWWNEETRGIEAMDQAFRLATELQLEQIFGSTTRTNRKENDDASFGSWHEKDMACAIWQEMWLSHHIFLSLQWHHEEISSTPILKSLRDQPVEQIMNWPSWFLKWQYFSLWSSSSDEDAKFVLHNECNSKTCQAGRQMCTRFYILWRYWAGDETNNLWQMYISCTTGPLRSCFAHFCVDDKKNYCWIKVVLLVLNK